MDVNSGVYRYIFNHYEYFDKSLFEFGFLTRAAVNLMNSSEYLKYRFNVHSFTATQRDNPQKLADEIKEVLSQYDIIHLHTSSWRGFLIEKIAMEMGMQKVIVHSHSTGIDVTNSVERLAQYKEHSNYRNLFSKKYATDYCACCYKAANWLFGDNIPKSEIKILPNAIDVKKFLFNEKIRKEIRGKLQISDKYVVGHVGRYSYTKNQLFLIELISQLKRKIPNIMLICIGEGENKPILEKAISDYKLENYVMLIDWVENINDYLQAFDLFCLPSLFEGLPISVIEAQAIGLPCIVSDYVTDEIAITSLVCRLSLNHEKWVNAIKKRSGGENTRRSYDKELIEKGYNVKESAEKLMKLWG